MLLKILIALVVILALLAVVVAMQPAEFRFARSTTIAAPPAVVFAQVNDFHAFNVWNPWAKMDPAMRQTYEGAPAGAGAIYTWDGNNQVGSGRMTIIDSRPNELVRMKLEFLKPFAATNTADFDFRPEGNGTAVTWSMSGRNAFVAKAMSLVMDMDKMIGGQFDKGLADLKAVAESKAS